MADDLIPISDEQAKAVQEVAKTTGRALELSEKAGAYIAWVLGTAPADLVGILGGTWLHQVYIRNVARCGARTKEILDARGVTETVALSPSLAVPLLQAAANDSQNELQELWARLLAAAMDPTRTNLVRQRFAEAIRKLDPPDTRVLTALPGRGGGIGQGDLRAAASDVGTTRDEFEVSLENLVKAELLSEPTPKMWALSPFGREFLRAVMD